MNPSYMIETAAEDETQRPPNGNSQTSQAPAAAAAQAIQDLTGYPLAFIESLSDTAESTLLEHLHSTGAPETTSNKPKPTATPSATT